MKEGTDEMEIQDLVRKLYDVRKASSEIASMLRERGLPPTQIREELLAAGIPSEDIKSMMAAVFPGIPHVDVQAQPLQDVRGAHTDFVLPHGDIGDAHADSHTDIAAQPHQDFVGPHIDILGAHVDIPGQPHVDVHWPQHTEIGPSLHTDETPHIDTGGVAHIDTP